MKANVRYVKRITIPLTRACQNNCLYCGFRNNKETIVSLKQVSNILELAKEHGCSEIRLMAGADAHKFPPIEKELAKRNLETIPQYAFMISSMILNYGFLPTLEIGLLTYAELAYLKNVTAGIHLLLEGKLADKFTSYKDQNNYFEMIENAGKLNIPFNTGIIVGIGETAIDRFNTIAEIGAMQQKYRHIQEFTIQGYVLNENTKLPLQNFLSLKELVELYKTIRKVLPDVMIGVQPNTLDFWLDLIKLGAESIGGISEEIDYVVPRYTEKDLLEIPQKLGKAGFKLQNQLPLTLESYRNERYSNCVAEVLNHWTAKKEYRYYKK